MTSGQVHCVTSRFRRRPRSHPVATSTPAGATSSTTPAPVMPTRHSYVTYDCTPLPVKTVTQPTNTSYLFPYRSPVRVEFSKFSSTEGEDPLAFIEQCEEYLTIHPLTNSEIIPTLSSVLENTAKDW